MIWRKQWFAVFRKPPAGDSPEPRMEIYDRQEVWLHELERCHSLSLFADTGNCSGKESCQI